MKKKERIKNFLVALQVTGRPEVPNFEELPEDLRKFFKAMYKVVIINEALNDGKRFDIYDSNVGRYYPWFRCNGSPSGFAFDVACYDYTYAYAGGVSRLCLKDSETAEYAGSQFTNEYREMLEF